MTRQISLPFAIDSAGRIAYTNDPDVVDQTNLLTLISTQPGERSMRASYGVDTKGVLFSGLDSVLANQLITEIGQAASVYAPEIIIGNVRVIEGDPFGDNSSRLDVQVQYAPGPQRLGTTDQSVVTVPLVQEG